MACSEEGQKEVVEILLNAGADVNHQDNVCKIYDCPVKITLFHSISVSFLTFIVWFTFLLNSED